jgi:hypothetical protein
MSPEEARIRTACEAVEETRRLLLSPSLAALCSSMPHLERAAACLKAAQAAVPPEPAERRRLLSEALALRQSLNRASALLEHAAAFYMGWSRRVAEAAGGYTNSGEPATPALRSTLSVEG